MKTFANILWILFGGIWLALFWAIFGVILCVTIIGIPFGLQCFKAARLSLFPFGKKVELRFKSHPIANFLWIFFGGWIMALFYLICGAFNCITIIGIPKGLRCFKLMKLALSPFGAKIMKD